MKERRGGGIEAGATDSASDVQALDLEEQGDKDGGLPSGDYAQQEADESQAKVSASTKRQDSGNDHREDDLKQKGRMQKPRRSRRRSSLAAIEDAVAEIKASTRNAWKAFKGALQLLLSVLLTLVYPTVRLSLRVCLPSVCR